MSSTSDALGTVRIRFAVEGMARKGAFVCPRSPESVLEVLRESGLTSASFDSESEIFTVEFDPAVSSFHEIRQLVSQAGELERRVYLAVPMSL